MVGGEQIIGGNGARDSDSWNHVCPNATRKALAVQNTECSRGQRKSTEKQEEEGKAICYDLF